MDAAPPVLSRREREVAVLVAEGLSNREIAERLFISERTAEGHVEQIRNKLGFKSRTQVAAWVAASSTRSATAAAPSPIASPVGILPRPRLRARWLWGAGASMLIVTAVFLIFIVIRPALSFSPFSGPRIITFAGTGRGDISQDGLAPAATDLIGPEGLAVTLDGDVYIADGNRIRVVHRDEVVSTVVGSSNVQGPAPEGKLAKQAQLVLGSGFVGLAVDGAGDLFLSDTYNNRVLKVTNGIVSTVITAVEPRGLALDQQGDLFVAETGANRVVKVDPSGALSVVAGTGHSGFSGDGKSATTAELSAPEGLAFDQKQGDLYIADAGNDLIRKVNQVGVISTFAGNGTTGSGGDGGPAVKAELYLPVGLAVDATGILYIADSANNQVREVDVGGIISTVAGTKLPGYKGDRGPAAYAELNNPVAVAVDGSGNLYIADLGNNRVRLVRLATG